MFVFIIMFLLYILPSVFIKIDISYYNLLNLPVYSPNQLVFPIIWTVIYFLNSLFLAKTFKNIIQNKSFLILWITNYFLNISYTPVFFNMKSLFLSMVIAVFIFITNIMLFFDAKKINKKTFYLLVPYLLWSLFASILATHIYLIN